LHDETVIYLAGASSELQTSIAGKQADIKRDTLSREFHFVDILPEVLASKEIKIAEEKLQLGLRK
jgi:hypothetical protein